MKRPASQQTASRKESAQGACGAAGMDFAALVSAIREVHSHCAAQVCRTVNVALTLRSVSGQCTPRRFAGTICRKPTASRRPAIRP